MARQNIDEKWKTDPRRTALADRIGGRAADGMRVEINWLLLDHKGQAIPVKVFQFVKDWDVWVECGLASIDGDLVNIAGADAYREFFDKQKTNASKGGKAKAAKQKPKLPRATQTRPDCPSFSFSSSFSISEERKENINTNTLQAPPAVAKESPISVYCEAYKSRYSHNPVIGPKEAGILNTFAKNYPAKWHDLVVGYLQMPDKWAVQRSHPVELLTSKLNEIQRFLLTGKVVTQKVSQHLEDLVDKAQGSHRKPRRSPEEIERERKAMLDEAAGIKAIEGAS